MNNVINALNNVVGNVIGKARAKIAERRDAPASYTYLDLVNINRRLNHLLVEIDEYSATSVHRQGIYRFGGVEELITGKSQQLSTLTIYTDPQRCSEQIRELIRNEVEAHFYAADKPQPVTHILPMEPSNVRRTEKVQTLVYVD
ncbi:MAG: hypothetical protein [Bacteriophage sp.]|nr:MAG: hypothetical protein [Bacteriophage sp.]